jgi:hypothetical protein
MAAAANALAAGDPLPPLGRPETGTFAAAADFMLAICIAGLVVADRPPLPRRPHRRRLSLPRRRPARRACRAAKRGAERGPPEEDEPELATSEAAA